MQANPTQGLRDGACDRFGSVLKAALAAGAAATLTLSAQAADLSVGARVFNNTCGIGNSHLLSHHLVRRFAPVLRHQAAS